jgi:hypothetical protein
VEVSKQIRKAQRDDPHSLIHQLKARPPEKVKRKPKAHFLIEDVLTRKERARQYANAVMHPEQAQDAVKSKERPGFNFLYKRELPPPVRVDPHNDEFIKPLEEKLIDALW